MRTQLILGLSALLLLCSAAVNAQQKYDGRNGPHVFGSPGEQVYIRGQNEGTYQVPGVAGTFQNAPAQGQHVYTNEQGNSYVHQKKGAGRPGGHSISGPSLVAQRGDDGSFVVQSGRRDIHVTRPDGRSVSLGPDHIAAQGYDGRTAVHSRHRRARVQGEDYVVRGDQAGVWNDNVSVGKRPDGRTVTLDSKGNVIISGSPNGRGPQRYSGEV